MLTWSQLKQRTLHSKRIPPSVFPPQKFKQREICERSVHRETFLHSLDRIAHAPLITKIAYNEEIPPAVLLSIWSHFALVFCSRRFVYVPVKKWTQNLFPCLWDNFENKKVYLVRSSFVFHSYLVDCVVDLDASK